MQRLTPNCLLQFKLDLYYIYVTQHSIAYALRVAVASLIALFYIKLQ